ncbi:MULTISPECIES: recombinase family protein [Amycolatopsis]|uniref:Recombinase family protein n=1 Tax=Amycolatopsis tucumanensis TaxID=401106 RepID=A0ABP7JR24_9PSEU|nr:recombinase family protein [Amycolatopsis tucumanensis]MCF6425073.1 recombinase family protein [Amycolatopsis tucumanensis]
MKLVAYLRVSTAKQLDGFGLDVQRKAIQEWCAANGHKVVAWCEDPAVSGAKDAVDRPGLTEALQKLRHPGLSGARRAPEAEGLVVARLDRLARALTVQEAILGLAWQHGAHVFTADTGEVLRDDPDDPMRTAMRQMAGVFAELDRRTTVKRLRDGIKAKAASGRKATGSYAYGYRGEGTGKNRDAVRVPQEQRVIRRMVEMRQARMSYPEIAARLQEEGFRPRKAAQWSAMTVRNILVREMGPEAAALSA